MKEVLFVCSAGMLRSATAAHLAHREFEWNTRCAGIEPYAVQPIHQNTVEWAQLIFCMESKHFEFIKAHYPKNIQQRCVILDIPDNFSYRDMELEAMLRNKLYDYV